ncbi:MAG: hypothetical protein IKU48_03040 [Clostridia bacterium]|nr:hypothetical protein [Clostridia bacterium]
MVNIKVPSIRGLMIITTERSANMATEIFREDGLHVKYSMMAEGTASSDILDMLGLGSTEKRLLLALTTKEKAERMLKKLHLELSMSRADGGIGFTLPITSASGALIQMMSADETTEDAKKDEEKNMGNSHAMITVMLNRGFSNDAMKVAKEAGARGGTVIHSRQVIDEEDMGFWGMSMQEEKEMLLIITEVEKKHDIMKAITEQFGMHSEAKGIVVSMPIDTVMGI